MADAAAPARGRDARSTATQVVTRGAARRLVRPCARASSPRSIGPSGSGKSTLLHLLGLLDRPTGGRIILRGCDTGTLGDRALGRFRGRTIGFVFQFHHLLPAFTALENVMMPILADRGRRDAAHARRARACCSTASASPTAPPTA